MTRREELAAIFEAVDEGQRKLLGTLMEDVLFFEEQMAYLKTLPFIRVSRKNPSRQETTPAAKQFKEMSQSYMNAIRILASALNKGEGEMEDPVAAFLERRNG